MTRLEYNIKIINKLKELIIKYPDMRFGQLLVNCEIVEMSWNGTTMNAIDPFNEESESTWKRMLNNKFAFYERFN